MENEDFTKILRRLRDDVQVYGKNPKSTTSLHLRLGQCYKLNNIHNLGRIIEILDIDMQIIEEEINE